MKKKPKQQIPDKINVRVNPDLMELIDRCAKQFGISYPGVLRMCALKVLKKNEMLKTSEE